ERYNLWGSSAKRRLGVLADEYASLVVVGSEEGVNSVRRIRRAVECDDKHAFVPRFPDRGHDSLAVVWRDQDGIRPGGYHVLNRRHLAGVVAVGPAGAGEQFGALGVGSGLRAFSHLYEERIRLGLGCGSDYRQLWRREATQTQEQCDDCDE